MRGIALTLPTAMFLLIILAIYVGYSLVPIMPSFVSYSTARNDAAIYWWNAEFNGGPDYNNVVLGGCVDVFMVIPFNEATGDTEYDELNEVPRVIVFRRCAK